MMNFLNRSIWQPHDVGHLRFWFGLIPALMLSATTSVGAAMVFTGDVPADFAGADFVIDSEQQDVGIPPGFPFTVSGWDIRALYFAYDSGSDTARFGLDFFGISGDADGDGDPNVSSSALTDSGGQDLVDLALSETIAILFDVDRDVAQGGNFEFVVGVPSGNSPNGPPLDCGEGPNAFSLSNCFGMFDVDNAALQGFATAGQVFFAKRPEAVARGPVPSANSPDFEFAIPQWSVLLAKSGILLNPCEPWSIDVRVFAGSFQDAGIGEDAFPDLNQVVTLNFSLPNPELCACVEDLNVCEDELAGSQVDSDGDGTPDIVDQCPQTVSSAGTDLLGCSQAQFCSQFSGKVLQALRCSVADWKNDEPLGARDCRFRHGTCIPRQ